MRKGASPAVTNRQTRRSGLRLKRPRYDIPEGHVLEGNVTFNGDVRVYGHVRGNVDATGDVLIAGTVDGSVEAHKRARVTGWINNGIRARQIFLKSGGFIRGSTLANHIEVEGTLAGEAKAKTLKVVQGGTLAGEVFCNRMIMEDGGRLACNIGVKPTEVRKAIHSAIMNHTKRAPQKRRIRSSRGSSSTKNSLPQK